MSYKITGDEPLNPTIEQQGTGTWATVAGITIRQYFANNTNFAVPDDFYEDKLVEFNRRQNITRITTNHPSTVMNYKEIAEVKNAWKVFMADSLIAELNK